MNRQKGTTLLSVMVSSGIILVALTIAVTAFYSSSRLNKQSNSFVQASNFAESMMEKTIDLPYSKMQPRSVSEGAPKLPEFACRIVVTPKDAGLKEVTVVCSWLSGNLHRETKLSTLVASGERR